MATVTETRTSSKPITSVDPWADRPAYAVPVASLVFGARVRHVALPGVFKVVRAADRRDSASRYTLRAREEHANGSLVGPVYSWRVDEAPPDLQDRRVEITGPTDRKMVINALNSGARVFMADFEDANSPTWSNLIEGQRNMVDAIERTISLDTGEKSYSLNEQTATLLSRRDADHRKRASSTRVDEVADDAELAAAEVEAASWRAAGDLRREINSLVGQLAARTGAPHGVVHGRVRKAVPGPPSAAAPVDVLAARRDWLLEQTVR